MPDHVDSVKQYVRLMDGWRKDSAAKGDEARVQAYDERLAALRAVVEEVENFRRVTKPVPASYGDLSDLPAELVKELSGIKVDDLEQQLFTIIKTGGDEVDLDAILIELFRRFKIMQTRKFLQNKLWRMAQKEVVFSVPGRKGVYTAVKPTDDFDNLISTPALPEAAPSRGGWGAPSKGGFEDDLDDDIPF